MSRVTDTPRPTMILALACVALLLAACGVMAPTDQPAAGDQPAAVEQAPAEQPQPEEDTPPQPTEVIAQETPPAGGEDEDVKGTDLPPESAGGETPESPVDESGEPPKVDCPGALPPRLSVGEPARVTFSNGLSVRVREEPSTDDSVTVLFMLPEGSVFTVIGGPECAENWLWWEIEMANGVSGWASEGSPDQGYFLEPYTP